MSNLLRRLLNRLKRKPEVAPLPLVSGLQEAVAALDKPTDLSPKKPKGRVIKQTRGVEFDPNSSRKGGRVVRVMPRQLQKIKQAQEKFEDDSQPKVEDLED